MKRSWLAAGLVLVGLLAYRAQAPAPVETQGARSVFYLQDFSGGLNTDSSSVILQDNESPDLLNVVLDTPGAVIKREGASDINASAIGGGISDVQFIGELLQVDGDRYCVAVSSITGYYSTDGCITFTAFVSTLTRNNDVNCEAYNDSLYCVNNQYNFAFDGSADTSFTTNPVDLDYIRVHRDRCFAAGTDASPYRLYWSAIGDCTSWTVSTDYVDVCRDDGDAITGIGTTLFDALPIYCRFSTWALKGSVASNFTLVNISRTIGAKSHRSIQTFENIQLFDSLGPGGGQPGVYANNGIVVKEASKKLRGELDQMAHFSGATGRKIIDTKADFDAGTFDTLAMSSSRESGYIQPLTTTMTDTSSANFVAGTLTNVSPNVDGQLNIYQNGTTVFINAGGQTDGTTNWTAVQTSANPIIRSNAAGCTLSYGAYAWRKTTAATGAPVFTARILDTSNTVLLTFQVPFANEQAATVYTIDTSTLAYSQLRFSYIWEQAGATDEQRTASFVRGNSFAFQYGDGHIDPATATVLPCLDIDETVSLNTTGNIVSRTFDSAASTPTWGLFAATVSSDTNSAITFEVQSSTANDGGGFEALVAETLDTEVSAAQRRYIRYKASYTLVTATNTPAYISDVTMTASSTGTWQSDGLFLSNAVSAGGIFQCQQTVTGSEASIAYDWWTASTEAGLATATHNAIACGDTLTSLDKWVQVRSTHTIGVATETAKIDNLVFNWTEGTVSRSPASAVFKNRYHICGQSASGSFNDTCYVLHDNGAWSKFSGIRPRSLGIVNQNFIIGDSTETSGGFLYEMYSGNSDSGDAIEAYWESKDLTLGPIHHRKAVDRLFAVTSNDAATLTATLKMDTGNRSDAYTIATSTGGALGLWNKSMSTPRNANTFRIRWGNNAASAPWSLFGIGFQWRDLGLMLP